MNPKKPAGLIDREADEYTAFLNQFYDEEFRRGIVRSARARPVRFPEARFFLCRSRETLGPSGYEAERLLDQHFAPLLAEARGDARVHGQRVGPARFWQPHGNPRSGPSLTAIRGHARARAEASQDFFGSLKKIVKKVAGKAGLIWERRGISVAPKLGFGPLLNKLKSTHQNTAAQTGHPDGDPASSPAQLQPIARKSWPSALPFLREIEAGYEDKNLEPRDR